ncbi:hypothetical protein [Micromonospora sp. NBC_00617]|uniref:hypothetical protein n=1 Tax=Micromonospora sp. NBC_00617 TaxID=2903587 RepID=UPI0030DFEF04
MIVDIMHPNYVATVRSVIEEYPGVCMVQPGVEIIDADGKVVNTMVDEAKRRLYAPRIESRELMGGEDLAASLLRGCWFYFPSICWRSDVLKAVDFRDEFQVIQDLALVIDLIERGEQMAVDNTLCFQYRRHAVSKSAADAVTGSRFTEARAFFSTSPGGWTPRGGPGRPGRPAATPRPDCTPSRCSRRRCARAP